MNNIDKQYQALLQDILDNGVQKTDRTGTGTISVFGRQIRHNMKEGLPLLTTKRMPFKTIVTELLWFLRGDTNIKFLVDNDCHIWNGDAYKNYLKEHLPENGTLTMEEFIELIKQNEKPIYHELGELGPIYGKQWRSWEGYKHGMVLGAGLSKEQPIDQIQNLISDLKTNPDSRRLMVNAWNVGELDQMVLPPCHFSFQCYSHEKEGKRYLSLAWNQRSVDCGLGLPFNIASYGLLLEILAKEVGMISDQLIGNLGDCHLYNNHIEPIKEQLNKEPFPLPKLKFRPCPITGIDMEYQSLSQFEIENYQSHPTIKLPLSN